MNFIADMASYITSQEEFFDWLLVNDCRMADSNKPDMAIHSEIELAAAFLEWRKEKPKRLGRLIMKIEADIITKETMT